MPFPVASNGNLILGSYLIFSKRKKRRRGKEKKEINKNRKRLYVVRFSF